MKPLKVVPSEKKFYANRSNWIMFNMLKKFYDVKNLKKQCGKKQLLVPHQCHFIRTGLRVRVLCTHDCAPQCINCFLRDHGKGRAISFILHPLVCACAHYIHAIAQVNVMRPSFWLWLIIRQNKFESCIIIHSFLIRWFFKENQKCPQNEHCG